MLVDHNMPDQFTRLPLIDISIISASSNKCTFTVESVIRGYHIYEVCMVKCNRRSTGLLL